MMAVEDGTLCRITSSREDYEQESMFLVKTPAEERKECKFPYKLVFVGGEESETELPSEKSDDELTDEDLSNFVFTPKGIVKEDVCEVKLDQASDTNKQEKEEPFKEQNNNNFRQKYDKNRQSSGRRNLKSSNRGGNKHFRHSSNNLKAGEKNYANSNRRNFHGLEGPVTYDSPVQNFPSNDIEPWIKPLPSMPYNPIHYNPNFYGSNYPCFANSVETVGQSPVNSFPENSVKSKGLLGDAPFPTPPFPPDFQRMNQNDNYISDQSYCERNWSNEYPDEIHYENYQSNIHYENYQRRGQSNRPVSGPSRQNFRYPNKPRWQNNRKKPVDWNKNQSYKSKGRNSSNTYKPRATFKQRPDFPE